MSEFHNLLSRLNEKDILLSTPKMDNSNYTEALDFLTGRELSKLKRDALAEYQATNRKLAEAREDVETYKYDLETLVSILHDCLHNMSQEECLDTLRQVDDHYEKLKEGE